MEILLDVPERKISEPYFSLLQIIEFSRKNYIKEIEGCISFLRSKKSPTREWFEFIYCILAGTQVRTSTVRKAFESLFEIIGIDLNLENVAHSEKIEDRIKFVLKLNGYRFYESKANLIINVAKFFIIYDYNPDKFLEKYKDYKILRTELRKIKGIGLKIASHWLRNIGIEIPIIDSHIKDILIYTGIIRKKKSAYYDFENKIFELSVKFDINLFILDLAIWIFGREFCANRKCHKCILNSSCLKIER